MGIMSSKGRGKGGRKLRGRKRGVRRGEKKKRKLGKIKKKGEGSRIGHQENQRKRIRRRKPRGGVRGENGKRK